LFWRAPRMTMEWDIAGDGNGQDTTGGALNTRKVSLRVLFRVTMSANGPTVPP
jgi:hypothetical protein